MIKREFKNGILCKADGDDGDALLFAALRFVSGSHQYTDDLDAIKSCQDETGRFWRSPSRKGIDKVNSFSRDMALGVIIMAAGTIGSSFDASFIKWCRYLNKKGKLCPDATDSRGRITPAIWWLIACVNSKMAPSHYSLTRFLLKPYLWISAATAPAGYQRHLVAVMLFVLILIQENRGCVGLTHAIAGELVDKEINNPFFQWLRGNDEDARLILKSIESKVENNPGRGTQWAWERTDSEEAWKDSCGHDLDFMRNLLLNGIL
jgi:hypothetical protein